MKTALVWVGLLLLSGCVGSVFVVEEQLGGDDIDADESGLNAVEPDPVVSHPTLSGGAPAAPTTTTPWFVDAGAP